jgi:NAD(P)-dependent dehydrogenase (short-subunit alcohol dehydrogenase family)
VSADLHSRVAIVTGGSSGIGAGAAEALAGAGARIALVGRDERRLREVAMRIESGGGICHSIKADLGLDDAPAEIVAETIDVFGALQILVCAAGMMELSSFAETAVESLDQQWRVNTRACFLLTQAALPHLRGDGSIVFLISPAGEIGQPTTAVYGMTKAALAQLTRTLGVELAPEGIRVNAISPGWIATPMNARLREDPEVVQLALATTPAGRLGTPEDIGPAVVFLASPGAAYITGAILPIGGGYPALPSRLLRSGELAAEPALTTAGTVPT